MPASSSSLTIRQKSRLGGVLVGGILIHLSLGTLYTFGNLNPYLTSYMRLYGNAPNLTYTECSWVFALAAMGQGASMTFGGILEQFVGLKLASLIGCWLMSLGVFLTHITVQKSFYGVVVTYGLMTGLGTGLAYALPLSCAMRWMPHRKGLMNGLIVAGFGGGAFIFDQVQKVFINPNNEKATLKIGDDKYFDQDDVLDKVPKVFLLLGGCYSVMQLIGCLLLANPPPSEEKPLSTRSSRYGEDKGDEFKYRQLDEEEINAVPKSEDVTTNLEGLEDRVYSPMQVIKSRHFYIIFFTFFFMGQGILIISTLYKAYGLTFISSDTFLSWTGTFAAVFNGLGRIFWGILADKFSYKVAAMIMASAFTCLLLTLQLTELAGRALFFIYVCLLFGCFSGSFSLFPTATAKCFGQKYMARNYGLVFMSQVLTAPIGVFVSHLLQEAIGWPGLFFYVAGSSFVAFILSISFNAKDKNGKDI